jgi:hypothetical protein
MLHSKKHLFFAKIIDIFPNLPLIAIIWYFRILLYSVVRYPMILGPFYQNKLLFGYRVTRFGYFLLPKTPNFSQFDIFREHFLLRTQLVANLTVLCLKACINNNMIYFPNTITTTQ